MAVSNSTDRFNGILASKAIKVPVRRATNANQTLTGPVTIDSFVFGDGDRILLYGQTNPIENGIWETNASSAWQRAPDFDGSRDAALNTVVLAERAVGSPVMYRLSSPTTDPVIVGTDSLTFVQYFDPDAPATANLQDVTDVGNVTDNAIFFVEMTAKETTVIARGQVWLRDDTPNSLIFTDDADNDYVIGGALAIESNDLSVAVTWAEANRVRTDINTATPPSGEAVTGFFEIRDNEDVDPLAQFGFTNGTNQLFLRNQMEGGEFRITAKDNSGIERTILQADPDNLTLLRADTNLTLEVDAGDTALTAIGGGETRLYHNNVQCLRTDTLANGACEVNNTLTGIGWERVLTTSDAPGGTIPASTQASSILRGDGAGDWIEETDLTITAGGALSTTGSLIVDDGTDTLGLSASAGVVSWIGTGGITLIDIGPTVQLERLEFQDTDDLVFGTGDDVSISWDTVDLEIVGAAGNQTINFRDGFHLRLWDSSDTDWLDIHNDGANINLTESGLAAIVFPAAGTLALDMTDNIIDTPRLKDYSIESDAPVVSANAVTLTYSNGPAFEVDLEPATGAVVITISGGPPAGTYGQITVKVQQDGSTAQTISFAGGTIVNAGGTLHPMNTTLDGISIYTLETWDGGTTWYVGGADYS